VAAGAERLLVWTPPPPWFAPVAKLTLSWHAPQACIEGTVFQLFTSLPPPVWRDSAVVDVR
jgi:hypothetical protein